MADVNLIVEIPVANPFKFILDGANSDERADFDQRRLSDVKNASNDAGHSFDQPWEKVDSARVQFYSNFPLNRVSIIDCDDVVQGSPMTPSIAVQYRNKKYRSACKLSSINGKLFIYFMEGLEYLDEDFLVPGELVALNGVTPNINALPGDLVRFSINSGVDFISTTIASIVWNPALSAEGYLTDLDYTLLSPIDGLVEITYDQKPANLLSQALDFSALTPGTYRIRYQVGIADYTISFTTEPIDIQTKHEGTLALEYRHDGTYDAVDMWSYIYLSTWTNLVRIPTDFYKFTPAGEVEADNNDRGIPRMTRAIPYRQITISFINMPGWLADKIQVALSHDKKIINDYEWEIENYGQFEMIDQLDLGTYEVNLRQKNDRTKKVNEFPAEVTASFDPDSFSNIAFAGDVVTAEFISNTLGLFRFLSLPAWITTDLEEFSNGDIVEFTIAANATSFDRSIQLIAISDDFDGLQATIDFQQDFDDSIPEFIDVDDDTVLLAYTAGSNQLLNVSSSGDYNITFSGTHTFQAVKESGFTQVRVSEATANNTGVNRTGTVRLTLQSNPAVFKDISVTQTVDLGLISTTPAGFTVPPIPSAGATLSIDIDATVGTQWQASSSQTWCIVNTSIHTGSLVGFSIFINEKPSYIPGARSAQVTLVNIINSSDTLTVYIVQQ